MLNIDYKKVNFLIEEINLIHQMLLHPAGFEIGVSGILLVRKYEYPIWVVEYEDSPFVGKMKCKEFDDPFEAAKCFCVMRFWFDLGLDYEK